MARRGVLIAAPASGVGKTTVTLAILRALARRGADVAGAKSGPDYIDPAFHAAATGRPSVNLDAWAMQAGTLRALAAAAPGETLVVEGAVGLLDGGGTAARGSAADLAAALGLPVVLVLDAAKAAASVALAPAGLAALRPDLRLAGVILNRIGSPRHLALATAALARAGVPLLGHLPRDAALALPERHLGLVQATEHDGLDALLDAVADRAEAGIDLDALLASAMPLTPPQGPPRLLPPPGRVVALARDAAFAFAYPHLLDGWAAGGAAIRPFSPLADEAPDAAADAVLLPGGYPELHAARLAAAARTRAGLAAARDRGAWILGECGGYMTLGERLIDAEGRAHRMMGLLPVETSFARRRLTLGYRRLIPRAGTPWAGPVAGHEFHYATLAAEAGDLPRLFDAEDADGAHLPAMGLRAGRVMGSFAHLIGPWPG